MKALGMLTLALALSAAAWWWFTKEMPRREHERVIAAEAAAKEAERANSLYRWRDTDGNLQITETPPQGLKYERISREPQDGIQVDGARE